jgi:dynein heavy chain
MPYDGHCILLGEPENGAVDVCEMISETVDCYYEAPLTQITEIYWRETLKKLIKMCLTENRRVLFFISDDIPSELDFDILLSDLNVIMNNGGLPLRLFGQQHNQPTRPGDFVEQIGSTMTSTAQSMEWTQRQEMIEKIRSRLHVVISMSRRTIVAHSLQFYDLFHRGLIVNMDNWMRDDMVSFTTTAISLNCELAKEQVVFCVEDIIGVHDVMTKLSSNYDHSDFINFVKTYCQMIIRKKRKIESMEQRYQIGIQKLNKADEQMNFLQEELVRLQPELVRTSLETT